MRHALKVLAIVGAILIVLGVTEQAAAAPLPVPTKYVIAAHQPAPPPAGSYQKIAWVICKTFTVRCDAALDVSWCESSFRPWASDYLTHTHLGLYELGPSERKTYGHGKGAWVQARSALKLYNARGWQPWSASNHCHHRYHTRR